MTMRYRKRGSYKALFIKTESSHTYTEKSSGISNYETSVMSEALYSKQCKLPFYINTRTKCLGHKSLKISLKWTIFSTLKFQSNKSITVLKLSLLIPLQKFCFLVGIDKYISKSNRNTDVYVSYKAYVSLCYWLTYLVGI